MAQKNFLRAIVLFIGLSTLTSFISIPKAQAWGKRGHSIVCQTAAYLASDAPKGEFLKAHSFDLGYYCNVPDLIWKQPETYQLEWFNHFMDMEIFDREIPATEREKAFAMDRLPFNAAYPQIPDKAGRSFWRIRELLADGQNLLQQLQKTGITVEEKHKLQADWLIHAGAMGHYVGDLCQPLHVTENYDGQMSGQKGVHVWFEDLVVDELFQGMGPSLESEVMKAAQSKFKKLAILQSKESPLERLITLANQSNDDLKTLLAIDKKVGRKDLKKAARAYHDMIVDRMASGAVVLAGLWGREIGWDYDGNKFYSFVGSPAYLAAPRAAAVNTPQTPFTAEKPKAVSAPVAPADPTAP